MRRAVVATALVTMAHCGGLARDDSTRPADDASPEAVAHRDDAATPDAGVANQISLVAMQVAVGSTHACALTRDGAVYCWGDNLYGELGTGGSPSQSTVPLAVSGLGASRSVSVAETHTCAVTSSGGVFCWGTQPTVLPSASTTPLAIAGLNEATLVSTSARDTCVLANGAIWCWGFNEEGQLGDGTTENRDTPVQVVGLPQDMVDVSTGANYACATSAAQGVFCWGGNLSGTLGDGSTTTSHAPIRVLPSANAVSAAGFTCALENGEASCWGSLSPTPSLAPVGVAGLPGASTISVGVFHACATTASGAALCWGRNAEGELGDGSSNDSIVPTPVAGIQDATSIVAGDYATCAVTSFGHVLCWGFNWCGILGTGATASSATPVPVVGF